MKFRKDLGKLVLSSFLLGVPLIGINSQEIKEKKEIIVLDPGHGNKDVGKNVYGVIEKDLNLEIARKIRDSLELRGYEVYLTREEDKDVNHKKKDLNYDYVIDVKDELLSRAKFSQEKNADYFFSLHFNYNNFKGLDRMEVYYYGIESISQLNDGKPNFNPLSRCNDYSKESVILARDFENYIRGRNEMDIKVYGTDFDVLFWKPAEKALLLEFGYLSNTQFRNFAKTTEGKDYFVNLFLGFFDYLESKEIKKLSLKPRLELVNKFVE